VNIFVDQIFNLKIQEKRKYFFTTETINLFEEFQGKRSNKTNDWKLNFEFIKVLL
jgi:hypothetical protein